MICHIVLFKIKEEYKAQLPELATIFAPMLGKVEGLLSVQAGPDILHSPRSYDLALVTTFRDRACLDAYVDHPAHQPVKARMHQVRESSVSCDFEL